MASNLVGTLRVLLTAETAEYQKNLKSATGATNAAVTGISGGVSKVQNLFKTLGGAAIVGGATRAIVSWGQQSINAASDVGEAYSKFQVVFGDTFEEVEAGLDNLADLTGLSKFQFIDWAATLGDTFKPLGFTKESVDDLSVSLVELAVDLGSFNNLNTADVIRDIQSAVVGNTETLRKYGVVASQAAIEQKAYEMGIWDGIGALDAQNKALAITQILYDGTTDAQGDAIRTADSYANRVKALEAAQLDLSVATGEILIPITQVFVDLAIKGAQNLQIYFDGMENVTTAIRTQGEAAVENNLTWEQYIESLGVAGGAVELLNRLMDDQIRLGLEGAQAIEEGRGVIDGWAAGTIVPATETNDEFNESLGETEDLLPILGQAIRDVSTDYDALATAVDLVDKGIGIMSDSMVEAERIKLVLKIATEDLTEAEIFELLTQQEQLQNLENLNQALEDGIITKYDWLAALADGVVTTEEYNEIMGIGVDNTEEYVNALIAASEAAQGLGDSIDGLPTDTQLNIDINVTGDKIPRIPGGGDLGGRDTPTPTATGLDRIVPPGFYNDDYLIGARSGERVIVLTGGEQAKINEGERGSHNIIQLFGVTLMGVNSPTDLVRELMRVGQL